MTSAAALAARLLDDYEKGAKFERADAKDVLLRLDEEAFPEAFSPGGREAMDALTADVDALERAGAAHVVRQRVRGGGERVELRMGPAEVRAAYAVAAACGYRPLRAALDALIGEVERLLAAAEQGQDAPDWWRAYLGGVRHAAQDADLRPLGIGTRARIKTEWPELRDALAAADRLSRTLDGWARHVSETLFADSKRLTAISARVAGILRVADPRWSDVEAPADPGEVLQAYGIRRRPPTITCAGAVVLRRGGAAGERTREYQLADFQPVAVLPGAWGPALAAGALAAGIRTVTTVENEYPFFSYVEEAGGPEGLGDRGELVVWTSGFLADHLLDLLTRMAAEGGPEMSFRHWGDADPAGLSIWWQIRSRLGRPVALYRSTAEWVEHAAGREGQPLTEADRRLLAAHVDRFRAAAKELPTEVPPHDVLQAAALAKALLRLEVKLEQERA